MYRSSLLSNRLTAVMLHVILNEWLYPFTALVFTVHRKFVLTRLLDYCMADATWNRCRLGAGSVYTIQACTSLPVRSVVIGHSSSMWWTYNASHEGDTPVYCFTSWMSFLITARSLVLCVDIPCMEEGTLRAPLSGTILQEGRMS